LATVAATSLSDLIIRMRVRLPHKTEWRLIVWLMRKRQGIGTQGIVGKTLGSVIGQTGKDHSIERQEDKHGFNVARHRQQRHDSKSAC
jgi:hypothetical protein